MFRDAGSPAEITPVPRFRCSGIAFAFPFVMRHRMTRQSNVSLKLSRDPDFASGIRPPKILSDGVMFWRPPRARIEADETLGEAYDQETTGRSTRSDIGAPGLLCAGIRRRRKNQRTPKFTGSQGGLGKSDEQTYYEIEERHGEVVGCGESGESRTAAAAISVHIQEQSIEDGEDCHYRVRDWCHNFSRHPVP